MIPVVNARVPPKTSPWTNEPIPDAPTILIPKYNAELLECFSYNSAFCSSESKSISSEIKSASRNLYFTELKFLSQEFKYLLSGQKDKLNKLNEIKKETLLAKNSLETINEENNSKKKLIIDEEEPPIDNMNSNTNTNDIPNEEV